LESASTARDAISGQLTAQATGLRATLRSTYTLYDDIARIDIVDELTQEPSDEPQCSWFAFPLHAPDHRYFYDSPAAILRPGLQADGGDQLPGAGRTCIAVQSFLAAAGGSGSITLASPDAYLFQLGGHILRDPLADSDPRSSLALSTVLHNFTRNDFGVRQGGQQRFTFRYSLCTAAQPFQAGAALKFAKGIAQPLATAWASGASDALDCSPHSFLGVAGDGVIASGFKRAEDGPGWVLRLWEVAGRDGEVEIDIAGMGATRARCCDLLERAQEELEVRAGIVRLAMPARGLRAIWFE
jgi:hypothetical protein